MEGEAVLVRDAEPRDAAAIARIHNEGIEERVATLETELRTPEDRVRWLAGRAERHPVLVAVQGEEVVGWGALNQFNPRAVYDFVADFSVYVTRERRGRGIGRLLLEALETRARSLGYHKMVLAAFPHNIAGARLYERAGFRHVGVYREQGKIDGKWVDVIIMEKILGR